MKTESRARSIIKGVSWRITGTIDTIILSWLISGKLDTALQIGSTEFATKLILYYLHERVWIRIYKDKVNEARFSLLKAFTWRAVGSIDTMLLGWLYTGSHQQGFLIAGTEVITKIVLFYIHERIWARIPIGTVRKWVGIKEDTKEKEALPPDP